MSEAAPFPFGATVRIVGKRGRYKVRRTYPTGEVLLWGGTWQHEKFRTVTADKLRHAEPAEARR